MRQTCSTRRTATISTTPQEILMVLHTSTYTRISFDAGLCPGIDLALELERGIGIDTTLARMTQWQSHNHDPLTTFIHCSQRDEA